MIVKITPRKDGKYLVVNKYGNGRVIRSIMSKEQLAKAREADVPAAFHPTPFDR
jgi:hypothetical protein